MSDNENKRRRSQTNTTEQAGSNTSETTRRRSKENKGKRKFKPVYIIPIVFIICCVGFGYYIMSSLNTSGPVYGQRCATGLTLDDTKFNEAQTKISDIEGISSIKLTKDCLIIKMEFKFNEDVSLETARQVVTDATHVLDDTMGYPKNSEEDVYSKLLSIDGDRRQYDLEIVMFGGQEGFPAYGSKQFKNNEITFTDANPKDQAVTDSVIANQGKD